MIKKYLLYVLYNVLVCTLLIVCSKVISIKFGIKVEEPTKFEQGGLKQLEEKEVIRIPTEEEIQELEESYETIYFSELSSLENSIRGLYKEVKTAKVCSTTNRYFNSLEEEYNTYTNKLSEVQGYILEYEEKYNEYVEKLSKIPQFSASLRNRKYDEFHERIEPLYNSICEEKQNMAQKEVDNIFFEAKSIADELYYEYYDPMTHIVYAESGNCPPIDCYYVANVIENRVKSDKYPNTIIDVIYQSGQYQPAMTGSINKEPSDAVKEYMELYLRGKIITGMPENVFYQAKFEQGHGVWKYMPSSRHYFCY